MIDLHCHLLPGIDDGPAEEQAAFALARAQVAAGVDKVLCTPHVAHGYPANTGEAVIAAVQAFRERLAAEQIPLRIQAGAEVAIARAIDLGDDELALLHLGASDWLLLEPPLSTDVPRLAQLVSGLQTRGHRILIAHPERCAAFHQNPRLLGELVEDGALAQITASSLTGQFGRTVARLARTMVDEGVAHVIASDAHDAEHRAPGLAEPLAEAGLAWITEWACQEVPHAMLAGEAIPPRPEPVRSGRRSLLRRR